MQASRPPDPTQVASGALSRALGRVVQVRPEETRVVLLAVAYLFFAFSSWYVLRPIRDEMGLAGGVDNLKWLFGGTLLATLLAQPLFGALVARWPRRVVVTVCYRFFAANLVLFFAALRFAPAEAQVWIGRGFFIWSSLFTLFVVSLFWSFVVDLFREEAGRRLFGLLAAGGTLGAIAGASATAFLVERLGSAPLLLLSAALLEVSIRLAAALGSSAESDLPGQARAGRQPVGGGWFAGITEVARSPYLLGIGCFLVLYTIGSTFLYLLQARIVAEAFAERAARTAFFARVDLIVNVATLALQTGVTGRMLSRLGVPMTLAILPALSIVGFAALGALPTLAVLVAFQVARRAANFAIARPAREILYIPLRREEKYKAKNFLDTTVYRFGDQVGAWAEGGLKAIGLGVAGIAGAAVPLAAVWLALSVWLGRRHRKLADVDLARAVDVPPSIPT